ncbi:MAG: Rne/Rng family ribonuclease [Syntrophobacteraceae bacterium]|jgi:ribonuclease E|nr:Rne/Rng family ribonuclease [Syntrophobacteraceae bacterium]MCU0587538.1 Rne/Rng family ribonuclease [Syntrophobacteraceae bacterium]
MAQQVMIINAAQPEEFRVALVEGQTLEGFFIETASRGKVVGNIYKGIITHVQTSLQAAFVNFGMERNGFLPFTEIHPEYYRQDLPEPVRIQDVMETGQEVLVQVVKEEIGSKGALLTTYISLAGRDVVLMPGQSQRGVSRKIDETEQREQLKELVRSLTVPEEMGIIIRTAALNRTKREIAKDLNHLLRIWEEVKKKVQESAAPSLIYKEQDLAIRVIRDYFNPDIKTILVDDREVHRQVKEFLTIISPRHENSVKLHKDDGPICAKYNLEDQIEQIFRKKVPLKSGGHLLIDQTEALVAIDVNSGRTNGEGDLEEMVYKVNMEAATEIPRQLRLRDLGGLVVIDFIDMRENRHSREVERRLKEEVKKDKAKITLGKISRFGLLELSRQHLGLNILRGSFRPCPLCQGAGIVRSDEAAALSYLRKIWATLAHRKVAIVKATVAPEVANYLLNQKRGDIVSLEERFQVLIVIEAAPGVPANAGHIEFVPREG